MAVHRINKWTMTPSRKAGGIPRVGRFIPSVRINKPTQEGTAGPVSRDRFSGANKDSKKIIHAQHDHEQGLQP